MVEAVECSNCPHLTLRRKPSFFETRLPSNPVLGAWLEATLSWLSELVLNTGSRWDTGFARAPAVVLSAATLIDDDGKASWEPLFVDRPVSRGG